MTLWRNRCTSVRMFDSPWWCFFTPLYFQYTFTVAFQICRVLLRKIYANSRPTNQRPPVSKFTYHWCVHKNWCALIVQVCLRVEFLLKTDGGYPRDAGDFFMVCFLWVWFHYHHYKTRWEKLRKREREIWGIEEDIIRSIFIDDINQ